MKKTLLFTLMLICIVSVQAVTKVAYVTRDKTMDPGATLLANDPIIQVLSADANLAVTVKVVAADATIDDLSTYDVIIVQEGFGSGDAILKSTGSLALANMPKPFIYNKAYGLRSGKALSSGSGVSNESASLSFTVESGALTNDLFKACTIGSSNEITVLNATTDDTGATGTKSLNYNTGNVVSGSSTLLAQPTGVTTAIVAVNDMPAQTNIDGTVIPVRMITICMNFGAICANAGKNITDDGLTIWRNAVYMLAGLTVPNTKATLPSGLNDVKISTLSFDGKTVKNLNSEKLSVYSLTGKLVCTSNKDIDMSNFVNGIYLVKGQTNTLKVNLLK